jgi:hypothetical protein
MVLIPHKVDYNDKLLDITRPILDPSLGPYTVEEKPCSIFRLPNEILHEIVKYVNNEPQTLVNLITTCKLFKHLVIPILYHSCPRVHDDLTDMEDYGCVYYDVEMCVLQLFKTLKLENVRHIRRLILGPAALLHLSNMPLVLDSLSLDTLIIYLPETPLDREGISHHPQWDRITTLALRIVPGQWLDHKDDFPNHDAEDYDQILNDMYLRVFRILAFFKNLLHLHVAADVSLDFDFERMLEGISRYSSDSKIQSLHTNVLPTVNNRRKRISKFIPPTLKSIHFQCSEGWHSYAYPDTFWGNVVFDKLQIVPGPLFNDMLATASKQGWKVYFHGDHLSVYLSHTCPKFTFDLTPLKEWINVNKDKFISMELSDRDLLTTNFDAIINLQPTKLHLSTLSRNEYSTVVTHKLLTKLLPAVQTLIVCTDYPPWQDRKTASGEGLYRLFKEMAQKPECFQLERISTLEQSYVSKAWNEDGKAPEQRRFPFVDARYFEPLAILPTLRNIIFNMETLGLGISLTCALI